MDHFQFNDAGHLCAESLLVSELVQRYGTPLYLYSRATLERHYRAFANAAAGCDHLICYAVKANSNLAILNLFAKLGAGFDIVSGGELARVLAAGGDPSKVVFSGVAKSETEICGALAAGVGCFNVESASELWRIAAIAQERGLVAPISLRLNPDIDAKTHPYISTGLKENKFGIHIDEAYQLYLRAAEHPALAIKGVDCHIGSQLTELSPFLEALDRLLAFIDRLALAGIQIHHLDVGGGLGVNYGDETPPHPDRYIAALRERIGKRKLTLIFEPGRAIVANAGILVTRVEYLKENGARHFALVDAGMNDLLRPALYGAWQKIIPVDLHCGGVTAKFDIAGPVCESSDFLGRERLLTLSEGALLAVRGAGAYGFSMASNYNSRPRPAEVMVMGECDQLIRERESLSDLWRGEQLLDV